MTSNALLNFGASLQPETPQTSKAAKGQKKNSAGGYSFKTSKLEGIKRFLLLGTDGSSYLSSSKMTADRATDLIKALSSDATTHRAIVDLIVEYSTEGRAVKQSPGLFALAVATTHGEDTSRAYAYAALPKVARTASTLFEFLSYRLMFGAWSMGLRKAIARWYTEKSPEQIAFQGVKYRQREGWTHRDVLRSAHPKPKNDDYDDIFRYLSGKDGYAAALPSVVYGYEKAKTVKGKELVKVIEETRVPWEALPTEALNDKAVWKALFENKSLPLGALIRQLPRLTRLGMFDPMGGGFTEQVIARLTDEAELQKARIHPIGILTSLSTYESGRGQGSTWVPNQKIAAALDEAFYKSFKYAEPSNKRFMFAIDLSASMTWNKISANLDSRDIAGALALVALNTEPYTMVTGFTAGGYGVNNGGRFASGISELSINKNMRLQDVTGYISRQRAGGTDAALPMLYAAEQKLDVDTFVVVTDNETWAGRIHPHEALLRYRKAMGKPEAQMIVLATTATRFSIADPKDPNSLDIPGFDAAVPKVISEFAKGL